MKLDKQESKRLGINVMLKEKKDVKQGKVEKKQKKTELEEKDSTVSLRDEE